MNRRSLFNSSRMPYSAFIKFLRVELGSFIQGCEARTAPPGANRYPPMGFPGIFVYLMVSGDPRI